ncbi:MAG TPA: UDP-N-acetylmuramoyl-L-alanyl-D-glutamate--2,6-diaminopimelate ligase [Rubrobacteraceae bacterium]|nr:UDP-N-acetylmuramoyl-L-alanyl-D-glutamate--2,6-diaminopimelate ligase [Rubrobacteraceae bacterium]
MILERRELERTLGARVPTGVDRIDGVTHDSRQVRPGFAFVAVPGFRRDGAEFVPDAVRGGAALIVSERPLTGVPSGVPAVVVPDARVALAALACAVQGNPSAALEVYGVTGTNGKTTTSYALYALLAAAFGKEKCGLMTTAEVVYGGERRPADRTTPEAVEVQGTLAEMLEGGVRRVVMEVSSHGVELRRVSGTRFCGAIFTNLTRDHLDLHGTMEAYYAAKRELFYWADGPKLANAEDSWGRRLAGEVEGVKTFGGTQEADYRVTDVRDTREGTAFALRHQGGVTEIQTPLLGPYNVLNVAGAAALALEIGVEGETLASAAMEMEQVPGRFERVAKREEHGFEVIVDYAHTDVGLEAVLQVARGAANAAANAAANGHPGRVICVFGAAGDRDGAKRPLMGRVASGLADLGIVTTDDAYSEDPEKIAAEVAAGADPERTEVILDRQAAIRRALECAREGDVVVIAGKGHERVQHLPEGDVPFHDATVVEELLGTLGR